LGPNFFTWLGWVGLGQSADGLGWVGSHKMDPWTTLTPSSEGSEVYMSKILNRHITSTVFMLIGYKMQRIRKHIYIYIYIYMYIPMGLFTLEFSNRSCDVNTRVQNNFASSGQSCKRRWRKTFKKKRLRA